MFSFAKSVVGRALNECGMSKWRPLYNPVMILTSYSTLCFSINSNYVTCWLSSFEVHGHQVVRNTFDVCDWSAIEIGCGVDDVCVLQILSQFLQ